MKYRPEIDGLRALAVVPVVLFHAGFETFAGGYTGVDIFFVISGYLITTILLEDIQAGQFTIARFYERRARRILPALFFLIICIVPFAVAWMVPEQLEDFGQGLLALAVFGSNILFWRNSDYFAPAAELNPLLHTWSLSVEEQFYVLFPLLLIGLSTRFRRWRWTVIVLIGVSSLLLSEILSRIAPNANFFLLPSRAWELAAGALCAMVLLDRRPTANAWLAALGLVMIVAPVFLLNEDTRFPSVYAIPTVIGTVLLILFAGGRDWTTRLLSAKSVVGIGLVSYSTYLWHQPLFAMWKIRSLMEPPEIHFVGLAFVSLGLGWFSWRFIETPFRRRDAGMLSRKTVLFGAGFAGFLSVVLMGTLFWRSDGYPERLPPEALEFLAQKSDINPNRAQCNYRVKPLGRTTPNLPHAPCIVGPGREPTVAIIGDSHGDAVASVFSDAMAGVGITSTQITISGCLPFSGYDRALFRCHEANEEVAAYVLNSTIDTVVLVGRYASVYPGEPFDNGEGGVDPKRVAYDRKTFRFDLGDGATYREYSMELFRRGIARYVDAGLSVVIVYPIPEAGWDVPRYLAYKAWHDSEVLQLSTPYRSYVSRNEAVLRLLDGIQHPAVRRVLPARVLCSAGVSGRCMNNMGATVYYYDHNHPTQSGASLLVPGLLSALNELRDGQPLVSR